MSKLFEVTDAAFEQEVLQAKVPVLVDFWAEWCAPCKAIAPLVEELAKEYEGKIKFTQMDVDSNPTTPASYGVRAIPTLLVFREGKAVEQLRGVMPKVLLKKRLEAVLAKG